MVSRLAPVSYCFHLCCRASPMRYVSAKWTTVHDGNQGKIWILPCGLTVSDHRALRMLSQNSVLAFWDAWAIWMARSSRYLLPWWTYKQAFGARIASCIFSGCIICYTHMGPLSLKLWGVKNFVRTFWSDITLQWFIVPSSVFLPSRAEYLGSNGKTFVST